MSTGVSLDRQSSLGNLRKDRAPPPPPSRSSLPAKQQKTCKALYDYHATDADELSFAEGQQVIVVEEIDAGWWIGELESGVRGMFPANYVEEIVVKTPVAEKPPLPYRQPALPARTSMPVVSRAESPKPSALRSVTSANMNRMSMPARQLPGVTAAIQRESESFPARPSSSSKPGSAFPKGPELPKRQPAANIAQCGECGCDDYLPNVFKQGSCSNCFHVH